MKVVQNTKSLIQQKSQARMWTYGIVAVLSIAALFYIIPPVHNDNSNALTGTSIASDTTLSISLSGSVLPLDITPTSSAGTFTSTASDSIDTNTAVIHVATNNITGYTLGIKASNPNSSTADKLISNNEQCENTPTSAKCAINSISSPTSEADYIDSDNTALNNTWGYLPSKYNSEDNTNYLPAPVSGDTIATTDSPNPENTTTNDGTLQSDEYTIDYGMRIDYSPYAGTYSTNYNNQSYIITAVGNPVPYSVSYNSNKPEQAPATSTVDNVPSAQTGTVSGGTTVAVILSSKVPTIGTTNPSTEDYTYAGYVFNGWCSVEPQEDQTTGYQTCPNDADIYHPGDNFGIDQTVDNTQTLYAVWGAPATVTFDANGLIYDNTATETTNTVDYIPTYADGKVTGDKTNTIYTGTYKTPAHPETTPATNYILKGWSTDQQSTDPTYTDEQAITNDLILNADDNITLYAVWTYATVITFDKNGADSGMMEPFTIEAGKTEVLPQNEFIKDGYVFTGWNTVATPTEQDPGEIYADQAEYQASAESASVALYAQWEVPPPEDLTFTAGDHIDTLMVADSAQNWKPFYVTPTSTDKSIVFTAPAEGTKYIITVVPEPDYVLSSDSTNSSYVEDFSTGTLASSTLLTTTYVAGAEGDNITISAAQAGSDSTHPAYTSMQDLTATQCPAYTDTAQGINVTDIRDNKSYAVAKFGNYCYMLSNLGLEGGTSLDSSTSDVSADTFTLPDQTTWTSSSQNHYCEARMRYINGEYYYNWYAAKANPTTGRTSSSSCATVDYASLGSICPAGWTLPTYDDITADTLWNNGANPGMLSTSGFFDSGSQRNVGYNGYWWSSTKYKFVSEAYYLEFYGSNAYRGNGFGKVYGLSVRCMRSS